MTEKKTRIIEAQKMFNKRLDEILGVYHSHTFICTECGNKSISGPGIYISIPSDNDAHGLTQREINRLKDAVQEFYYDVIGYSAEKYSVSIYIKED